MSEPKRFQVGLHHQHWHAAVIGIWIRIMVPVHLLDPDPHGGCGSSPGVKSRRNLANRCKKLGLKGSGSALQRKRIHITAMQCEVNLACLILSRGKRGEQLTAPGPPTELRNHCKKNFRDITWNVEENVELHEIFRVVSRFPRYISCFIAERRLPLGQCRNVDYNWAVCLARVWKCPTALWTCF